MNVLSLFDGMSCGQIALDRLGVKVDKYYASEVDKHAIKVTQANYPNTIQLGDVEDWWTWDVDWSSIDLLMGGSPCQGFSFAGKQLNFTDPRSKLFFEFVRVLKDIQLINPDVKFLLENVRMKQEFQDVISEHLGVKPVAINSNLVSAQNRYRLYWTNIEGIEQPEDLGTLLRDIVHENEYDKESNTLSDKACGYMLKNNEKWKGSGERRLDNYCQWSHEKANTITANIHKGVPYNCFYESLNEYIVPFDKTLQILDKEVERGKVGYFRKDSAGNRVYYIHGKACTLMGNAGGGAAKMGQYLFGCITPDRLNKSQNGQRFNDGKKFYTLTATDRHGVLVEGYIRKLTPIECERLQTVLQCIKPVEITLCLDQVKNFVSAVEKNPKLLKLVSSVENVELKEYVKLANQSMNANRVLIKNTARRNVDMRTQTQTRRCTDINQDDQSLIVSSAINTTMSRPVENGESSAIEPVFINITEGRLTHYGKEELPQKEQNYTELTNGKIALSLCGKEIMRNANDVLSVLEMMQTNRDSISITSSRLSMKNLEQILATSYWFAKSAIDGFTQDTTKRRTLYLNLIDGYTNHVSNTQRYKMLGNGWTVDVICHILKHQFKTGENK